MGAHPIPEPGLAAAPRLRIVAVAAAGYNIVDVAAATRRGILVTNTPGVLTETTADMAWALMLGVARRVPESDRFVRAGKWTGVYWSQLHGRRRARDDPRRHRAGPDRAGHRAARPGLRHARSLPQARPRIPEAARSVGAEYRTKADLLRESDFVVLSIPLTAGDPAPDRRRGARPHEADGLPGERRPRARGRRGAPWSRPSGRSASPGAGLDVFEDEPTLHPGLLGLENLALTPHIGSASGATRRRMATRAAENCVAALEGHRPPNLVNPEAWRSDMKRGKLWLFLLLLLARRRRLPDLAAAPAVRSA